MNVVTLSRTNRANHHYFELGCAKRKKTFIFLRFLFFSLHRSLTEEWRENYLKSSAAGRGEKKLKCSFSLKPMEANVWFDQLKWVIGWSARIPLVNFVQSDHFVRPSKTRSSLAVRVACNIFFCSLVIVVFLILLFPLTDLISVHCLGCFHKQRERGQETLLISFVCLTNHRVLTRPRTRKFP